MSFTPGSWEAYFSAGAGWSVRRKEPRGPDWTGLAPICSMAWFQFPIPGIIDEEISEANAQLIAAAPDLLAAIIALREHHKNEYQSDKAIDAQADAAIAKAKGAGS